MNIGDSQSPPQQLTLALEAGMLNRFRSAKDAMAAGVYARGLKRIAGDLDVAPGNLSNMLSDDGQRHLDVDLLERYIATTGDKTPILYLVARYCADLPAEQTAALEQVKTMMERLPELLASLGAGKCGSRKTR
jgi:hypothetical protein